MPVAASIASWVAWSMKLACQAVCYVCDVEMLRPSHLRCLSKSLG